MALYFRIPTLNNSFLFADPIVELNPVPDVISAPGDLYVTLPTGRSSLSVQHSSVQSWFNRFVAVEGSVSIAHDIPRVMYLSESPVVINFSATDGVNSQLVQRRIFITENIGVSAVMVSESDRFKLKDSGWKFIDR